MSSVNIWELFIINPGTLNIEDLSAFLKIMKFNPEVKKLFPTGFQLAEPINNNTGGILYPKDTELNSDRVVRLQQLKENNPDYQFIISIKKAKKVAQYFRETIKKDYTKILDAKKNKSEFRKSIGRLEKTFELYLDDILKNDELIYLLFRGRSIDEVLSESGIPRYFYHCINVSIFALEIVQNSLMSTGIRFDKPDLINIAQLGLVHDMGGMDNIGQNKDMSLEKKKEYFLKDASQSYMAAKSVNLENDVVQALKKFGAYHQGDTDIVNQNEDMDANYANVLITADVMDLMVSGLFGDPMSIRGATDQLYVKANNKELKRGYVDALAKGLKLNDLFDFYRELERLKKACLLQKYARPYPIKGFKSPVLILCGGKRKDCVWSMKKFKGCEPYQGKQRPGTGCIRTVQTTFQTTGQILREALR